MATFHPVNPSLAPDSYGRDGEDTTPTTPRPRTAPDIQLQPISQMDDATTPTRSTFGALASQRPLPAQPFPAAIPEDTSSDANQIPHRGSSQYSSKSRDSEDHDMDDSEDGEEGGSDEESVNPDGTKSKKKKSQRFYCTEFPPCTLSFTRSEHLARHIRKHTGERPFQCHCSRRFSRLDNLRQHAQTVHVNEEIPQDSLAATGTRFQRQVRTDRVRPPGSRSRASISGVPPGQVRGHHRNSLSASSISSVGSAFSAREDARRRPPPLQMAGAGARISQEIYRPDSPNRYHYRAPSPGGFSTPTSATFSTGQTSPRWGSGMQSPISSHSRTASLYAGHRTPGRRLSVPSSGNPFQSPHGGYGPPPLGNMSSSNFGALSPSSSTLNSPITSTSGWSGRRDSVFSATDEAWRRRTWHPDSHSNITSSRLQNVSTNYYSSGPPPQVPVLPSNAPPLQNQNSMRLPGIESFDPLPRPITPLRRHPSPMMIDSPSRAPTHPAEQYREERSNSRQWDMGINRNLNRLDITRNTPPSDPAGTWASETNRAVQAQSEQPRAQPTVRFEESPYSIRSHAQNHHYSAPPVTPKELKRQGWYRGPAPNLASIDPRIQRTSPAESSGSEAGVPDTPSSAAVGEFNPSTAHSNGYVEGRNGVFIQNPPVVPSNAPNRYPTYQPQPMSSGENGYTYAPTHQGQQQLQNGQQGQVPKSTDNNMLRLEALVAVATSEENVATAY